jgi:starch phosphorylase
MANPFLARLLTDTVGKGWVTNMDLLRQLVPLADDAGFRDLFWKAKRDAKVRRLGAQGDHQRWLLG